MTRLVKEKAPPCFENQDHFDEWLDLARLSDSLAPPSFCHDCTPAYKASMVEIDRCVHPETIFVTLRKRLENGDIELEQIGTRGVPPAMRRHIYVPDGEPPCP